MKSIGELLDTLGIEANLEDTDLVSSAVVILSVLSEDTEQPQLTICNSEGMGWIEQAGLLRLAERICSEPPTLAENDE